MNMQEHQEIKAFEVHNGRRRMMNLRHSRQKSKEWYNSCRSPQYQQDQLTKNKQVRSGKLGKMNNWRESENNTVSMGRIHELEEVDLNDYQVKKNEKIWKYETDAANRPKAPCPNINIWEERKAKQDALQELIPSSIEDEEAMIWKAVELSRAQAVEDEELRIAKLKLMNREVTSSSEIPCGTKKNEEECAPLCSLPSGGGSLPDTKSETDTDQVVKNTYSPSGTEILKLGKHKDEGRCGFEDFPSSTEPLKLEEQNNEGSRELEEDLG
ncbi:uncharacterized protein LOC106476888 [Limulus polyphemus]|uniref:Uncharacterized protein LOC106476888 n=1 Tax=Limulus polyphemus TaxID=6850 RepID=A0ABM1C2B0_LIMPO|nr:uncharacterized protein LOC106476888 [Limulus polyphemus]